MEIKELVDRLGERREAVLKAALQCKTAEELLELAQENGLELTAEQAEELLALLASHAAELSERDLEAVTGGVRKKLEFSIDDVGKLEG
ncbi:MAG TPA: hypothetical protein PLM25_01315 [Limnochordia bacterium]|nr:hypothetical protein [Limnochordia bacterium]